MAGKQSFFYYWKNKKNTKSAQLWIGDWLLPSGLVCSKPQGPGFKSRPGFGWIFWSTMPAHNSLADFQWARKLAERHPLQCVVSIAPTTSSEVLRNTSNHLFAYSVHSSERLYESCAGIRKRTVNTFIIQSSILLMNQDKLGMDSAWPPNKLYSATLFIIVPTLFRRIQKSYHLHCILVYNLHRITS